MKAKNDFARFLGVDLKNSFNGNGLGAKAKSPYYSYEFLILFFSRYFLTLNDAHFDQQTEMKLNKDK